MTDNDNNEPEEPKFKWDDIFGEGPPPEFEEPPFDPMAELEWAKEKIKKREGEIETLIVQMDYLHKDIKRLERDLYICQLKKPSW